MIICRMEKKKVEKRFRSTVNLNQKISSELAPDDALKLKLALATRKVAPKDKSGLLTNIIKEQIRKDMT